MAVTCICAVEQKSGAHGALGPSILALCLPELCRIEPARAKPLSEQLRLGCALGSAARTHVA